MSNRVGFMQGRLSPLVDGRIQAFPGAVWRDEFPMAEGFGLSAMEWTLDDEGLLENPFLTAEGRAEISTLTAAHGVTVPSVTGDCFMQAPFWKAGPRERDALLARFLTVVDACSHASVGIVVVPLVDNGRLETRRDEDALIDCLSSCSAALASAGVRIAFESDYGAAELARFIDRFDSSVFGINYDIGNSAGLGYNPAEEIRAYGCRIVNVHVKDRPFDGSTVPLGAGAADFDAVFSGLADVGYGGMFILQTARAADGDHGGVLRRYAAMTGEWLRRHPVSGHAA